MDTNHFERMKQALETEKQSAHTTHKVGALICGEDNDGQSYQITRPNFWPDLLIKHIGKNTKLGNASTTVHAEIAVICAAPATDGATIYVTDLPCPNCAKMIAESRIKSVYIDVRAHDTPLGAKMEPYFDKVSSTILGSAGVAVHEMNVAAETIEEIISPSPNVLLNIEHPVHQIPMKETDINYISFMELIEKQESDTPFAACFTKNSLGKHSFLVAQPQRSIGLSVEQAEHIPKSQKKYRPTIQPINRLLLTCARYGLKIDPNYLYCSQVPTSREFVNMIGAGYIDLQIGDRTKSRDKWGIKALKQLEEHGIMTYLELS